MPLVRLHGVEYQPSAQGVEQALHSRSRPSVHAEISNETPGAHRVQLVHRRSAPLEHGAASYVPGAHAEHCSDTCSMGMHGRQHRAPERLPLPHPHATPGCKPSCPKRVVGGIESALMDRSWPCHKAGCSCAYGCADAVRGSVACRCLVGSRGAPGRAGGAHAV
jgi:hypothetical protein